jgi:hypothetical protein
MITIFLIASASGMAVHILIPQLGKVHLRSTRSQFTWRSVWSSRHCLGLNNDWPLHIEDTMDLFITDDSVYREICSYHSGDGTKTKALLFCSSIHNTAMSVTKNYVPLDLDAASVFSSVLTNNYVSREWCLSNHMIWRWVSFDGQSHSLYAVTYFITIFLLLTYGRLADVSALRWRYHFGQQGMMPCLSSCC